MNGASENLKSNYFFYGFLILTIAVVNYLEFPFIQNSTVTPKWVLLSLLVFGFSLFKKKATHFYFSNTLILWAAFILLYLANCFNSYNFWDSISNSIPFVIAPLLIISLYNQSNNIKHFYQSVSLVLLFAILPLLLVTAYQLVVLIYNGDYSHANTYQFSFAFGHRNQYSQFITLIVPLLLINLNRNKFTLYLKLLTILFIYVIAVLLMNKTVLLVLFGVYPFVSLLFILTKYSKKIKLIVLTSILLLLSIGASVIVNSNISNTSFIGKLYTTDYGSGNERVRIWKNSFDLAKEKPILGHGSGDWKIEILRTPLRFTQAEQSLVYYKRAHNDFIQVLVENGIVGLVLLILFFIIAIYKLAKSDINRNVKYLLVSGVLGFLVVINLSFPLEKIELLLLLFIFILPTFNKPSTSKKIMIAVLSISTLIFSSIWGYNEYSYFNIISKNELSKLESKNLDFYSITPTVLPTYSQIGAHYYLKNDFDLAIKNYSKALKYNPYHVHVLNDLGSSYYANGNIEKAEEYYLKALKYNPVFTETIMNYTSLKFNKGDIDGGLNMILTVVVDWEPENYKMFISTIAKAKCFWLIDLHDEPMFKAFLQNAVQDDQLLYQISLNCRKTGACYEDELRIYFSNQN